MNNLLTMALQYAEHGFGVIPVRKDKKPYLAWTKYQTEKANSATLKGWWKEWKGANIALVTGKVSGLVIVDIDSEAGREGLIPHLPDSLITPTASTPRGGIHLYFKHPGGTLGNGTGILPGVDIRGDGGYAIAPPSNGSNGKEYEWLPGLSLFDTPLAEMPNDLLTLIRQIRQNGTVLDKNGTELDRGFIEGRRDETLFHIAKCLLAGNMPETEVEVVLGKLASVCTPPYTPPMHNILDKIKSAKQFLLKKERNIAGEVREWAVEAPGIFSTGQVDRDLALITREMHKCRDRALASLVKEKFIERFGDKRGHYRRLDSETKEVGFMSTTQQELKLYWPFFLERYFRCLPKNIIIIAGESDAGKTAFMLNLVKLNMGRYDIHYFLSEMGGAELRDRLLKFDMPLESWRFKAWERGSDFHDVIKPDAVNIIDFLEIYDEFYKVGGLIKQIYDRLNNGIAIIALQKNRGRDEGLGGGRSLEKARLYLAMEAGKLKIVKCKNWLDSAFNPNRLECEFKLLKGCQFIETSEWQRPEKKAS